MRHMVPTEVIVPLLEEHLAQRTEEYAEEIDARGILAEQAGLSEKALWRMFSGETQQMRFDTADRLLVAIGKMHLWYTDLQEHYWNGEVPPDWAKPIKCARPGCENWFELAHDQSAKRKYCSRACKHAASEYRLGTHRPRALMCRHGHPRSENDYVRPNGTRTCRECLRESDKRRRAALAEAA